MADLRIPSEGLWRVRFVNWDGREQVMTARPQGATQTRHGWIPMWAIDPPNQLGIHPGNVREILETTRIGD